MGKSEWPFAPLGHAQANTRNKPRLQGIVFDVDGTLCQTQNYMFSEMRAALGIEKPTDILEHLNSLSGQDHEKASSKIRDIERRAMRLQKPQPGLTALMAFLDKVPMPKAICTRNFDEPVAHLLTSFLPNTIFDPILTRAFLPPKPKPDGILHVAAHWGLPAASNLIMVGDSIDDMAAGRAAGATTVLLTNNENAHLNEHDNTDFYVSRLDDLIPILNSGFLTDHAQGIAS